MATDCNFRFQEGLDTLGVLQMMRQHPEMMKVGFLHKRADLSVEQMEDLLQLPLFGWSDEGSNNYQSEKRTLTHWRDFLQDLAGESIPRLTRYLF